LSLSGEQAVCIECVKNCKLSEALAPSSCNFAFNANRAPKDSRNEQFDFYGSIIPEESKNLIPSFGLKYLKQVFECQGKRAETPMAHWRGCASTPDS